MPNRGDHRRGSGSLLARAYRDCGRDVGRRLRKERQRRCASASRISSRSPDTFVEKLTGVAELGPLANALGALRSHPWSGNVRELRNVVEAAIVMGEIDLGGESPAVPRTDAPASASEVTAYRDARATALST